MDVEKLANLIKSLVVGEIKEEFKEFKKEIEDKMNFFNMRLDIFTKHVVDLGTELSKLRSDVNVALSQKEIINDILLRVESKV